MPTDAKNAILKGITTTILAVLCIFQICQTATAQAENTLNPTDKFSSLTQNSTISFAVDGTYSNATLKNGIWSFTDLRLNGSQPLEKLEVSTENSNITIFSHLSYDYLRKISVLTYFAQGQGKQTLNIGIGAGKEQGGINIEWSVIVNDAFIAQGDKWNITPEGTLSITGLSGNVTILYFSIGEEENNENLPFTQQHSIVILTACTVIATITLAAIIKVRLKKSETEEKVTT